jgi:putative flippase GtrA
MLSRSAAAAEPTGDLAGTPAEQPRGTSTGGWSAAVERLRQDDTPSQFARFVLVGAVTTAIYAGLFVWLHRLGYLTAHLIATAVTTALANEMHRRLTFRAEERVHWFTAQWEAGGITVLGLLATSAALGWLEAVTGTADDMVQITVVTIVTALIGAMRFLALRWIFRAPATATDWSTALGHPSSEPPGGPAQ